MLNIKGVVLAGGESNRMGTDKALLKRDHRDMVNYTVEQLENMALNGIVLSRNTPQEPTQVVRLSPLPVIKDLYPKLGPLGGIHAVVKSIKADAILIVPIDMPLLRTDDLNQLVSTGCQFHKPVYFDEYYLPLYLPLNDQIRTYLDEVVSGKIKNRSVRGLCNHFGGIPVQPLNCNSLHNTNTPKQWQAVQALLAR